MRRWTLRRWTLRKPRPHGKHRLEGDVSVGGGGGFARKAPGRHWLALLVVVLGGGAVAAGGGLVVVMSWPSAELRAGPGGFVELDTHGPGLRLASADATVGSVQVPLRRGGDWLAPTQPLPAGEEITVNAVVQTPEWIGWLAGHEIHLSEHVRTPEAHLASPVALVRTGARLVARFDRPVRLVRWSDGAASALVKVNPPSPDVALAVPFASSRAGSLEISAAAASWEAPPAPATLSYFPADAGASALASPAPSSTITERAMTIELSLSEPASEVFGARDPQTLNRATGAAVRGKWGRPDSYHLVFTPAPGAIWPGEAVTIRLPAAIDLVDATVGTAKPGTAKPGTAKPGTAKPGTARTTSIDYSVAQGSVLRMQQLLADLGYLPLDWMASTPAGKATTLATQATMATTPPPGKFSWRWAMPTRFRALWRPGTYNPMTRGAVMAFEHVEGLNPVGRSNPLLWPYLAEAALVGKTNPNGYSWVDVSQTLPEQLTLYHEGKMVLTSPANTGIPGRLTNNGTFPVYLRYQFQVMRGTNPNGSTYADPVHWISYFYGGEAVHGFVRASYGFPQSLGCVELPIPTAAVVWPYLHIGTLVTVHP